MYKFEASFTTLADLVAFTNTLGVGQINKISEAQEHSDTFKGQEIPAVIEEKKAPAKKAPAKKAEETKEVAAEVTPSSASVVAEPPHKQNVAAVQPEAPKAEAPVTVQAAPFDRQAAIDIAVRLVNVLKATGISDNDVMPAIHEVYAHAGCDLSLKISQFDDASLARFIPLFEQKVNAVAAKAQAAVKPTESFI